MIYRQSFADDMSLSVTMGDSVDVGSILHLDINRITRWAQKWLVKFNPAKSEPLVISCKRFTPDHASLFMLNIETQSVTSHKHLGYFLWEKNMGNAAFLVRPHYRHRLQHHSVLINKHYSVA